MRISIESTDKIVELRNEHGGVMPARIWEGHTESGIPVHCYVTRIAAHESQNQEEFKRALQEHRAPSAEVAAIPLRLVI